jgi:hypothetical protein
VVSGLERKSDGIIRVRATFLDVVLQGKLDGDSVELNRFNFQNPIELRLESGAPSTKWCVLQLLHVPRLGLADGKDYGSE